MRGGPGSGGCVEVTLGGWGEHPSNEADHIHLYLSAACPPSRPHQPPGLHLLAAPSLLAALDLLTLLLLLLLLEFLLPDICTTSEQGGCWLLWSSADLRG